MKPKMSAAYLAIFCISILMIFAHLIMAGLTGSSSAIGVFYWGYTVWKMYKRENKNLSLFNKFFMWLAIVGTILVCLILVISSESQNSIGVSVGVMLFFGALGSLLSFALMRYFANQEIINFAINVPNEQSGIFKIKNDRAESVLSGTGKLSLKEDVVNLKAAPKSSKIKDEYISKNIDDGNNEKIWERVYNEFNGETRRKGLWARLLVEFDGDIEKAKIKYFKERYIQLKVDSENETQQTEQTKIQARDNEVNVNIEKDFIFDNEARSVLYTAAQAYITYGDKDALDACLQVRFYLSKNEFENLTNLVVGMAIIEKSLQRRKVEVLDKMSLSNTTPLIDQRLAIENNWLSVLLHKNIEAAEDLFKKGFIKNSNK